MAHYTDSIQVPVLIDIRKLVEAYGSHYVVSYPHKNIDNDDMFYIEEKIGPKDTLNVWEHEHATLEKAYKAACNSTEVAKRALLKEHDRIAKKLSWKLHNLFSRLGMMSEYDKKELKEFNDTHQALKKDIEELQAKKANIKVVYLSGEYMIPQYMPEADKTYYYLDIANNASFKLTPIKLIPEETAIYDYRGSGSNDKFADQFDFKFSHYFKGENDEDYMIDSDRLLTFNGSYWNTGVLNCFLFVDEKEALTFAKNVASRQLEKLQIEMYNIKAAIAKI